MIVLASLKYKKYSINYYIQHLQNLFAADMGRLHHKCNRLRLLATCSITITNKENDNVIDYDYIESNHDYICLETSSERKQPHLHGLM